MWIPWIGGVGGAEDLTLFVPHEETWTGRKIESQGFEKGKCSWHWVDVFDAWRLPPKVKHTASQLPPRGALVPQIRLHNMLNVSWRTSPTEQPELVPSGRHTPSTAQLPLSEELCQPISSKLSRHLHESLAIAPRGRTAICDQCPGLPLQSARMRVLEGFSWPRLDLAIKSGSGGNPWSFLTAS